MHLPLRQKMERAGVGQVALASWCDVSQATISRVLNGQVRPGLRVVAGAMDLFGVDRPDELFDPATLTQRVRHWTTPARGARPEANRRAGLRQRLGCPEG